MNRTRPVRWPIAEAAILVAGLGCGSTPADVQAPADTPSPRPNYNEDVYPIFARSCFGCHSTGALAGIQLSTYSGAQSSAFHLRHVVAGQEMPPWGLDSSGSCGDWVDSRSLKQQDAETILDWTDLGAPEGDERKRPMTTPAPELTIRDDAARYEIADYHSTLADGTQRCFVIDPQLSVDRFLTGVTFEPRAFFGVWQVSVFALDSPNSEAEAVKLDEASSQPGYTCSGGIGVTDAHFLLSRSMASSITRLPDGTGLRLRAGQKLVAQFDYNVIDTSPSNGGALRLELTDSAQEGTWTEIRAPHLSITPGEAYTTAEVQYATRDDLRVAAIYPEMRVHGQAMHVSFDPPQGTPGGRHCLVEQHTWNFHLVREPRILSTPVDVKAPSLMTLTCDYNTLGLSNPLTDGDSMTNEECAILLYNVGSSSSSRESSLPAPGAAR